MGALKGRLARAEGSLRGELEGFELGNGETVLFAPPEVGPELFLWGTRWLRAQAAGAPYPTGYPLPAPEILRAVANAKVRATAADLVLGEGVERLLPIDREVLVRDGEVRFRSLVAGRDLGETARDLSE